MSFISWLLHFDLEKYKPTILKFTSKSSVSPSPTYMTIYFKFFFRNYLVQPTLSWERICSSKLLLLFAFIIFFSCKADSRLQKSIVGNWELYEGERNNQAQESLKGIFMNIGNDSINTNFNGSASPETVLYKLKGDALIQKDNTNIEYKIENQTDSTLQLYTELRGSSFRLYLRKTN